MVLTACFVLSAVIGLIATVAGAMRKHRRQLDLGIERPGPHDFAVRFRRTRLLRRKRPSHPAPNVRDDRDTPLLRRRDGADSAGDLRRQSTLESRGELARRANRAVIHIPNCTASP
jgi:hypothetical protein